MPRAMRCERVRRARAVSEQLSERARSPEMIVGYLFDSVPSMRDFLAKYKDRG